MSSTYNKKILNNPRLKKIKEIVTTKKVKKEPHKNFEDLNKNILELNKSFKKANSFKFSFLKGLLVGLGSAIGATIIAATVITILAKTIHSIKDIPILGNLIETTQVEKIIEKEYTK